VRRDDEAMRPSVVVVVPRDELEHGHGELVCERGSIGRRAEADLCVEGERGQS
jgi:hypothetical protein